MLFNKNKTKYVIVSQFMYNVCHINTYNNGQW